MGNKNHLRDQRLPLLSAVLAVEGEVSNARVRELFRLERAQATRLLATFLNSQPKRQRLVRQMSKWVGTAPPTGVLVDTQTLESYQRLTGGDGQQRWLEDVRVGIAAVDAAVLRCMRSACANGCGAAIEYLSMEKAGLSDRRIIYPHTIIRVGRRLHARAWTPDAKGFRDFVLSRMVSAVELDAPTKVPVDEEWEKLLEVELAAHKDLDAGKRMVIERELFGGSSDRFLRVRAALLPYVLLDMRVAVDTVRQAPPEYQLMVLKPSALKPYLFSQTR